MMYLLTVVLKILIETKKLKEIAELKEKLKY